MPSGLGYIGAAGSGFTQGFPQGYDQSLDQASQVALGRTLQMLQQPQMQGPVQGIGPPGQGGQSPMGGMPPQIQPQQMAGPPPIPQGSPPMPPSQGGGQAGAPTPQPMARGPIGQPGNPQPIMPPQQQQQPQGQQTQQPQGWGQQGGEQGGPLDWRQIFQAVTRANPGAPPQVIAGAVNRAVPLMNSQSQMEWKEVQAQIAGIRLDQGQQRIDQADYWKSVAAGQKQQSLDERYAQLNTQREQAGLAPLSHKQFLESFGGGEQSPGQSQPDQGQPQNPDTPKGGEQMGGLPAPKSAAERIADDIHSGKQAPVFGGWGGMGVPTKLAPAVRAAYANRYPNDNLAQMALKWQQEVKLVQTMNGPQQVRFRQLANSVKPFISDLEDLSRQMKLSGMTALNEAQLLEESRIRGNTAKGQLATKYLTAFAGARGEIAQLENGGYAPHDASWKTAYQQLDTARGVQAQLAALSEIKKIIDFRIQGMDSVAPGFAPGSENQYAPKGESAPVQTPSADFGDRFKGFKIEPVNQGQ